MSNNFGTVTCSTPQHPSWIGTDYRIVSGTNWRGNYFCRHESSEGSGYHYLNRDGSYYYSNPDGSTYYNNGRGFSIYTIPSGRLAGPGEEGS